MRLSVLISLLLFCWFISVGQEKVRYDYSNVAEQITDGIESRYEKGKAIYQFICDYISYDTSYTIYTADECWDNRKGVCQAYCELFKAICEPLDIHCIIISGKTKPRDHIPASPLSEQGHAWLLVEGENKGEYYLVDPTWGAGYVSNGKYVKYNNNMLWFDISPEWLIMSHFPNEDIYQFNNPKISLEDFINSPGYYPELQYFGFSGKELWEKFIKGDIQKIPNFSYQENYPLLIKNIPLNFQLNIAEKYQFQFYGDPGVEYALSHNGNFFKDWSKNGNEFLMDFIPFEEGYVYISGKRENDQSYIVLIKYEVPEPTSRQIKNLIDINPFYSKAIRSLSNFNDDIIKMGFDGKKILDEISNRGLNELPKVHYLDKYPLKIVDVPLNKKLGKGKNYSFIVSLPSHLDIALINNETWFRNWENEGDLRKIFISPTEKGSLRLGVKEVNEKSYSILITYDVN